VDLKTREGQDIVYRWCQVDVFLTNMRQRAVETMNMTYPVLRKINAKLIYAVVSAFGPKGPDRDRGGFDYQGQARSGYMYSIVRRECRLWCLSSLSLIRPRVDG